MNVWGRLDHMTSHYLLCRSNILLLENFACGIIEKWLMVNNTMALVTKNGQFSI